MFVPWIWSDGRWTVAVAAGSNLNQWQSDGGDMGLASFPVMPTFETREDAEKFCATMNTQLPR